MNKYVENSRSSKKSNPFHYTPEDVVRRCLAYIPKGVSYLDAGSGSNKVWFKHLPEPKFECEIDEGRDFYTWTQPVGWVVGNPPYCEGWKFLDKATDIALEGVGFLGNINFWSSITPKRIRALAVKGYYISKIAIGNIPSWYGRYYFIILTKNKNDFISLW